MKTKLLLGGLAILSFSYLIFRTNSTQPETSKASAGNFVKYVKCTAAQFLLDDIDSTQQIAPLFENLGKHSFKISLDNPEAQKFFDQGLRLTYAFNHAEAHRSFMEASRLAKESPMPYWGQAYALGPNINDPLPDKKRKESAWKAYKKAEKYAANGSKKEQALIQALGERYSEDLSADISALNNSYMKAMVKVRDEFPNDADVLTLYAAAVMNTMPWNYWDNDGEPAPNTLKAKVALEKAIEINPDHPGAHHYFIHMVELPKPELAITSAERLGKLMPAAGHIVHMPSHIYIRVGRYEDAVKANEDAILADEDYLSQCFSQGMYPLGYYPHNIHFLWSASSFLGNSAKAIAAAKKTAEKVPISELEELPFLQDFASTPLLAYTRFGKWNEILTVPYPGDDYKHLKMIWHYARGIAFIRKNNLKEAREELDALKSLKLDESLKEMIANYTNPTSDIANVAEAVLAGELAYAEGKTDPAIKHLKDAIVYEDQLVYSEPSPWHIPARQTLGAILLKEGRYKEAEANFREDLKKNRNNGWSLTGLYKSLEAQGKSEASEIKEKRDAAWSQADIDITTPIL